jgi:hypothetical protein
MALENAVLRQTLGLKRKEIPGVKQGNAVPVDTINWNKCTKCINPVFHDVDTRRSNTGTLEKIT